MAIGSPYRWPWLHSILTSPGRSKSLIPPVFSKSTCFACSPEEGILDFQPFALSEGPRPSHHPLCPEAMLGLP